MNRPKMNGLTNEILSNLSADHEPPCLSLYQPTHRAHPQNQQDPIRFRNLIKELEASLRQAYPSAETRLLLEPFEALAHDDEFWNHTLDGLAVLAGPGFFQALRLPRSVAELVVVADSYHTKPLRRFLQSVDRYQVLGLSLDKIRLFEGNQYALDELDLASGVPGTLAESIGGDLNHPRQPPASTAGLGGANHPMPHGQGGKTDEANHDADRFFRAVDRAILEHYSRPSGLPLILAALPEHHHRFRQVSQNPLLLADEIRFNPDSMPADSLRALAWQVFEPHYRGRLEALSEEYGRARSQSTGSDDLARVAVASASGRVGTLLLEADRQIAGRLDGATGRVELADLNDPHVDDLLDDLGELVANRGGTVLVIPAERMPSSTGLAAIYRY